MIITENRQKCVKVRKKMIESVECCGYGFPDTLWDIYYEYAED